MPRRMCLAIPALACCQLLSYTAVAQTNGSQLCSTLTAADTEPFVGKSVGDLRADQVAVQCRWNAGKGARSIAVNITKSTKDAESLWGSNKVALTKNSLKDEPGIGDHAFSVIMTQKNTYPLPGVYFYIIQKNHHLLIVSFSSDGPGTEQIRNAFRALAKKSEAAAL